MAECHSWSDNIAYKLLQFFDLLKSTTSFPVINNTFIHCNGIAAIDNRRDKHHTTNNVFKGAQEFLCHIGRSKHPLALWTVFNPDDRFLRKRIIQPSIDLKIRTHAYSDHL